MPEEIILETRGVTKRFDGFAAVTGVNYRLREGESAGIIGPNGAGKTTFFNLLTGMFPPTEGTVLYRGADITRVPAHGRVGRGIVRTFQLVSVFDSLTVRENLVLALIRAGKEHAVSARFFLGTHGAGTSPSSPPGRWGRSVSGRRRSGRHRSFPTATSGSWRSPSRSACGPPSSCWTSRSPASRTWRSWRSSS